VAPGELQALVGPSGAGKSTLMDRLAMRDSSGKAGGGGSSVRTGHVLVNGQPRTQAFLKISAYVPQVCGVHFLWGGGGRGGGGDQRVCAPGVCGGRGRFV
jgi:ABC-type multidrug transport system ATPase subunit